MVRPERVHVAAADAAPAADIVLHGKVTDTVFVGEKLNVYVRTDIGTIVAALANAARNSADALRAGSDVTVSFTRDDLLLFPD